MNNIEQCSSDPSHQLHVHEEDVFIRLPAALWDTVVDSIGQDYGLKRIGNHWTYEKAGFGGRYNATVTPDVATGIANYLDSFAGAMSQTWSMDPDGRGQARRESSAAGRAAKAIRAQLA